MADPLDIARAMVALPGWRWGAGCRGAFADGAAALVLDVDDRGTPTLWRVNGEGMAPFGICYGSLTPGFCADVWQHGRPELDHAPTLGWVEHGILAPAGVWVERVWVDGALRFSLRGASLHPFQRATLPEALLDGLRVLR